ncbi:hypothetical protein [Winogradskyella thalassocola]|uniref:SmpA / OmlA family protein n=1 Tax=Winogradskyella thalassocola TaxID=262004 RepID=A0A1G7XRC2_9FLAO|nr:hypothetical protein [Winogradskyella thalassocola]SDG86739.1 hypothetical protein SAMN04489796_101802 [Winogradskyella thalassocola]
MFLDQPTPKKKRKSLKDYFDFRNNQVNQVGLIFFLAFVLATTLIYQFNERFDSERWQSEPSLRSQMVDDVMDRDLFINDTKQDVFDQLGKPNDMYPEETDSYIYYVGERASFDNEGPMQLVLFFENNKVVKMVLESRRD